MANGQTRTFQPVLEKVAECEFFIDLMEQYRAKPKEFGFCLSAYLSAFKSVLDRFIGTASEWGTKDKREKAVARLKESSPEVRYLARARNVEVHEEGVRIELARRRESLLRNPSRLRFDTRFSRFDDGLWTSSGGRTQKNWFFCDMPETEMITLCRNSLKRLQQFVSELAETA